MDRLTDRQTNYDLQNDIPMTHDNLVANPANTKLLQFTGGKKPVIHQNSELCYLNHNKESFYCHFLLSNCYFFLLSKLLKIVLLLMFVICH